MKARLLCSVFKKRIFSWTTLKLLHPMTMRRWLNKPIRSWIEYVYSVASVKRGKSHATFYQFFFSSDWSRNWRESITNRICTKSKKSHDFFRTFKFGKADHTRVECYQLLFWHLTFVQFRRRKLLKERNYQKTLQRFWWVSWMEANPA